MLIIFFFYFNLVFPPPPPPAFLRDRIVDFRDFDYYDRREEYARDMYERRYPPPMIRSSRDSRYMDRPYPSLPPMPPHPPMRGDYPTSRDMFTRRSPPPRGSRGYGLYEDFSRDSFDDRRRGMSPTHRYAPY